MSTGPSVRIRTAPSNPWLTRFPWSHRNAMLSPDPQPNLSLQTLSSAESYQKCKAGDVYGSYHDGAF